MTKNDIEGEDELEFKPLLFVRKEDLPNTTTKWKISEALKQHYGNAENGNQFFDVIEMKKAFTISSPTVKIAKEIYQKGLPFSSSDGTCELDCFARVLNIYEYSKWEEDQK
ncbi:hypothetical protein HA402_002108 [Bradysia odoriphaga]|nr:hypothetical protein HA402_002108 [Bradysia odoriphaga]